MFRKYNKKILTAIIIVIVGIGLIGPGVLLVFAPQPQTVERNLHVASSEQILDTSATSSIIDSAGGQQ